VTLSDGAPLESVTKRIIRAFPHEASKSHSEETGHTGSAAPRQSLYKKRRVCALCGWVRIMRNVPDAGRCRARLAAHTRVHAGASVVVGVVLTTCHTARFRGL
jgi:hypothetical protein